LLKKLTDRKVVFCELVEHPGGSDGGEFPQYHTVGLADDGSAYYATDLPESPTDTFCDEDVEDYQEVHDLSGAISYVKNSLQGVGIPTTVAEQLLEGLAAAEELRLYLGEEDDE